MTDETEPAGGIRPAGWINRRSLLRAVGAGAAAVGTGGLLQACSSGVKGASSSSTNSITIGWIHPLTGPLSGFGAPDNWVISKIKATTPYKNGFKIGSKTYSVTIKSYDSQSSPTRAGDLARTAILTDHVDLLLASSTPETVNAVASQAESHRASARREASELTPEAHVPDQHPRARQVGCKDSCAIPAELDLPAKAMSQPSPRGVVSIAERRLRTGAGY